MAGGVVIDEGDYIHGVQGSSFDAKYARIDMDEKVFIALNMPLEVQYYEAERRKLSAHMKDIRLRQMFENNNRLISKS